METQKYNDIYRFFFEKSTDLLCVASKEGFLIKVNPEWERILGYKAKELEGQSFRNYIHPADLEEADNIVDKLNRNEEVLNYRNRTRHKDGTYRWLEWSSYTMNGQIFASARDITDQVKTEEAFKESEEQHRIIASLMTDFIFKLEVETDNSTKLIYLSNSDDYFSNNADEEVLKKSFIHKGDRENWNTFLQGIIESGNPGSFECRALIREAYRWANISARPKKNLKTGRTEVILGAVKDIQKRKDAEEQLRYSEEKFLKSFMLAPESVSIIDFRNSQYIEVNEVFIRETGYSRDEVIGKTPIDLNLWVNLDERDELLRLYKEQHYIANFETKFRMKSGKIKDCLVNGSIITILGERYLLTFIRDITEHRKAETDLASSNKMLQTIIETVPVAIFDLNKKGHIQNIWNPAAEQMLGWKKEEVIGKKLPTVSTGRLDEFNRNIKSLNEGGTISGLDAIREKKDGSLINYSIYAAPLSDQKGEFMGSIAALIDITERNRIYKELKDNEELIKSITQNIPGTVYQFYLNEKRKPVFTHISENSRIYLGIENSDHSSFFERFTNHLPADDIPNCIVSLEKAAETFTDWNYEGRYTMPDKTEKYIRILANPRKKGKTIYFDGIILDITNAWLAEKELADTKALLSASVMQSPVGMIIVSVENSEILWANDACLNILGIADRSEFHNKTLTEDLFNWKHFDSDGNEIMFRDLPIVMALHGKVSRNKEYLIHRTDGIVKWISSNASPIRNEKQEITAAMLSFADITEQHQTEEKFRDLALLHQNILDTLSGGVLHMEQSTVQWCNRAFWEIYGYEKDEVIGKDSSILYRHKADFHKVRKEAVSQLIKNNFYTTEVEGVKKDGSIFWVRLSGSALDPKDIYKGTNWIIQDITEERKAEEKFKNLADIHQLVLDAIIAGVVHVKDNHIQWANNAFWSMNGYEKDELVGQPLFVLYKDPEEAHRNLPGVIKDLKTKDVCVYEFEGKRKDGSSFWVRISGKALDKKDPLAASTWMILDIDEQKRAEEMVRKAEIQRKLNLHFFESLDRINRILQGAKDIESMMGDTMDEILSIFNCDRAFLEYPVDPESDTWQIPVERTRSDYPGLFKIGQLNPMDEDTRMYHHLLLKTKGPIDFIRDFDDKDAHKKWEEFGVSSVLAIAIYPKVGKPWQFSIHQCSHVRKWTDHDKQLFREISRRLSDGITSVLINRELRESEEKYRTLVDNMQDAVYRCDLEGKILFTTASAAQLFGYPSEEAMIGMNIRDLYFEPEHDKIIVDLLRKQGFVKQYELLLRRKDTDKPVYVMANSQVFRNREGDIVGVEGVLHDISERKLAEQALRESEDKFRSLAENALTGIFLVQDNVFMYVNQYYANIMGYTIDELLRMKDITQLLVADDFAEFQGKVPVEQLQNQQFRCRKKNGEIRYIESSATTIILQGKPSIIGSAMDITDRRKAEEDLRIVKERLELFMESATDSMTIYDSDLRLVEINKKALEYLPSPVTKNDLIGRHCSELTPFKDDRLEQLYNRVLDTGIPDLVQECIDLSEDLKFWFSTKVFKVGTGIGVIGTDITAVKEAENEIKALNTDLENRVTERTAQLEQANKDLEAFAYSVSHDLRAPIRHIDGFIRLLYSNIQSPNEKIEDYYKKVSAASKRMSGMIDELLNFSRLGRQTLKYAKVDTNSLIREVIEQLKPDYSHRNISWNIKKLPKLKADTNLMKIAFENIISNAIKYTAKKPEAVIEIGSMPIKGNKLMLYFKDNGAGFDMAYADKLFGVFQRLHTDMDFEGTGIGLANVKQIIQKHKGTITADSKINEETTFYITLPN